MKNSIATQKIIEGITKLNLNIEQIIEYIIDSEMGGHEDETDSWYSTLVMLKKLNANDENSFVQLLKDLKEKQIEEENLCN